MPSTYNEIINSVQSVMEDESQELLSYIPTAIQLAEKRLSRQLDDLGQRTQEDITINSGDSTLNKPDGFRLLYFMRLKDAQNTVQPFDRVTDTYLEVYNQNVVPGTPRYYTDLDDDTWEITPESDTTYTVTVNFQKDPVPLSQNNQSNYFSEHCPDALFFAVVSECSMFQRNPYLRDDAEASYVEAVESLNNEGRRERMDNDYNPNNPEGGQNTLNQNTT